MPGIIPARPAENTDDNATTLKPLTELERLKQGDLSVLTPEERDALIPMLMPPVATTQQSRSTSGYPAATVGLSAVDLYNQSRAFTAQNSVLNSLIRPEADPEVIRQRTVEMRAPYGALNPSAGTPTRYRVPYTSVVKAGLTQYEGEYGEKITDPAFRDWLLRRGVVLANMDPDDPDFISKGFSLWQAAGRMVAANPTLQRSVTPEEWLDQQYRLRGGDSAYETLQKALKPNPITTTVNTQTYTINAEQAQGVVDSLSQALLGRMASDAELKRARGVMQKLLTPTVTTVVQDATDPSNIKTSTSTKAGVGPEEAQRVLQMRMQRGSEGMAFNVGSMFEEALTRMG